MVYCLHHQALSRLQASSSLTHPRHITFHNMATGKCPRIMQPLHEIEEATCWMELGTNWDQLLPFAMRANLFPNLFSPNTNFSRRNEHTVVTCSDLISGLICQLSHGLFDIWISLAIFHPWEFFFVESLLCTRDSQKPFAHSRWFSHCSNSTCKVRWS